MPKMGNENSLHKVQWKQNKPNRKIVASFLFYYDPKSIAHAAFF